MSLNTYEKLVKKEIRETTIPVIQSNFLAKP